MLFEQLTKYQNALIDQGSEAYKYHQDMRNIHTKGLCSSFDNQSSFYSDKTFYMFMGRALQLGGLVGSGLVERGQIFERIIKNIPTSNSIFDCCDKIFTPYHESKLPAVQSTQLTEQKKLETLTQSDTVETNKADRLQQTIQSAKEVHAQQLLKATSN